MIHRHALRCLGFTVLVAVIAGLAPAALAEPIPQGREIHIFVKKRPEPHIDKVLPNSKGVCREGKGASNKKDDCEKVVAWVLKGSLPDGWRVEVRLKEGVEPYCLKNALYTLSSIDVPVSSEEVDPDPAVCKRFYVWPYDVVLLDGDIEVDREDPLVVINY